MSGLAPQDKLDPALSQRILRFQTDAPNLEAIHSVHRFINFVHQTSKAAFIALSDRFAVTDLGDQPNLRVTLLDEDPVIQDHIVHSPLLRGVFSLLNEMKDRSSLDMHVVLKKNEMWITFNPGIHSTEMSVRFDSPDEDGGITLQFTEVTEEKEDQDIDFSLRPAYFARTLEKFGFHVYVQPNNLFLSAVLDKDHGLKSAAQVERVLIPLINLIGNSYALDLDTTAVKKTRPSSDVPGEFAEAFLAEGMQPFHARGENAPYKYRQYQADRSFREGLRQPLNSELERLLLPLIPPETAMGQRTIDLYFNRAIQEGLATGELALKEGTPHRNPEDRPVDQMLEAIHADGERALETGAVINTLSGYVDFKTLAGVGPTLLERGYLELGDGSSLVLYALRDWGGGQVVYGNALRVRRVGNRVERETVSAETLYNLLVKEKYEIRPLPVTDGQRAEAPKMLRQRPSDEIGGRRLRGLPASAGTGAAVWGMVTYNSESAAPPGSAILLKPYTTPQDVEAIENSAAVVTTGGGILSHAGITTRELGIPSVILPQGRWRNGKLVLPTAALAGYERRKDGVWVSRDVLMEDVVLEEGDIVMVDGEKGAVRIIDGENIRAIHQDLPKVAKGDLPSEILLSRIGPEEETALYDVVYQLLMEGSRDVPKPVQQKFLKALQKIPLWKQLRKKIIQKRRRELEDRWQTLIAYTEDAASPQQLDELFQQFHMHEKEFWRLNRHFQSVYRYLLADFWFEVQFHWNGFKRRKELKAAAERELQDMWSRRKGIGLEDLPQLRRVIRKLRENGIPMDRSFQDLVRIELLLTQKKFEQLEDDSRHLVLGLDRLDGDYTWLVGGKAANLGTLMKTLRAVQTQNPHLQFLVPDGFAVTDTAWKQFLAQSGIYEKVVETNKDPSLSAKERIARIQALIDGAPLTGATPLGRALLEEFDRRFGPSGVVAVRSSALREDSAKAAFAGMGDTLLHVTRADFLDAVKTVWKSLWNEREAAYAEKQSPGVRSIAQGLVVQAMVGSEVSGILFTQNPVNRFFHQSVVDAAYGLGLPIMDGRIQTDQYVVRKKNLHGMEPPFIGSKRVKMTPRKGGGTEMEEYVGKLDRKNRALTLAQVNQLVEVGRELESYFGYGLDIEFGIDHNGSGTARPWLFQVRPITKSRVRKAAARGVESREPPALARTPPTDFAVCGRYFPEGRIRPLALSELPVEVLVHLETQSRSFVLPQSYRPGSFQDVFLIEHDGELKTFLARQRITDHTGREVMQVTYFIQMTGRRVVGWAALQHHLGKVTPEFRNKPFVSDFYTGKDYRRQGLGAQRLRIMNAVSQMFYGLPLYSDVAVNGDCEYVWRRLAADGEARLFGRGSFIRYVFLGRPPQRPPKKSGPSTGGPAHGDKTGASGSEAREAL
ncbi:MAG: hypothetical protein HY548_08980, partial [Elusimicrobia bacterium]|nr:hypothetical protein [Elusimicrobiota bacterium]